MGDTEENVEEFFQEEKGISRNLKNNALAKSIQTNQTKHVENAETLPQAKPIPTSASTVTGDGKQTPAQIAKKSFVESSGRTTTAARRAEGEQLIKSPSLRKKEETKYH